MTRHIAMLPMLLAISSCTYTAIPMMSGTVLDSTTDAPIAHATVTALGRDGEKVVVTTSDDGQFHISGEIRYGMPYPRFVPDVLIGIHAAGYKNQEMLIPIRYGTHFSEPFRIEQETHVTK